MFTGEPFAQVIDETNLIKVEYSSAKQFYILVEAVAIFFLFINLVVKHRRIYNNQPIQKNNGFALFWVTLGIFSNLMLLGSKFNMTTYEVIGSGEEMQFVNPVNSTVSLLELPLTYVIYLHLAIFAFLFILHLILFVLCGKYGDISPVVIRKKKEKKKKEDKQKKKDEIKEDSQAKSREPKMIFYDGPVPKSDNEIFIGLRDGDDIEVEPLSEIRKNVNTSKNVTPKEIKKEVEKVIPSPIKETPKKVENVQVTPKKVEPKPVSSKPVEQISFTSNYQKRADEIPFEDEDINIFTKKSDNESISTFSQSNTKFDFKNMCLDSHDEYYGNDDEEDEELEVEVPEI